MDVAGIGATIADLRVEFPRPDSGHCSAGENHPDAALAHTYVGDLVVTLTSPSGTTIRLADRAGGTGNNFCDTLFDDGAGESLADAGPERAPFSGSWRPAEELSKFNGENADGRWLLGVADHELGGVGEVRHWCLHFNYGSHAKLTAAIADADHVPAEVAPIETPDDAAGAAHKADVAMPSPAPSAAPSVAEGGVIEGRWLRVAGEKFFPIGVWQQPPGDVRYFNSLGINTYFDFGWGAENNRALLDSLAEQGMFAVLKFDAEQVDHPALLAWMFGDEPDGKGTTPAELRDHYAMIRSHDPLRPIVLNSQAGFFKDANFDAVPGPLGGNRAWYREAFALADIASFDVYPVTGWNNPSWLYLPGAATRDLSQNWTGGAKPVWAIVEASDQDLSWTPPATRGPTAEEMRFEVWHSIINGATGITYFTIAFNPFRWRNYNAAIELEIKRTNNQITRLTDVILSDAPGSGRIAGPPGGAPGKPGGHEPLGAAESPNVPGAPGLAESALTVTEASGLDFAYMVRPDPEDNNAVYIFALNADMARRPATIRFQFEGEIASVTVVDEDRDIAPENNAWSDLFAPLELHVYRAFIPK